MVKWLVIYMKDIDQRSISIKKIDGSLISPGNIVMWSLRLEFGGLWTIIYLWLDGILSWKDELFRHDKSKNYTNWIDTTQ